MWDASKEKVEVLCDDFVYKADVVLVTCSLGVLKEESGNLFSPALPEKKHKAIEVTIV